MIIQFQLRFNNNCYRMRDIAKILHGARIQGTIYIGTKKAITDCVKILAANIFQRYIKW